MMTLIAIRRIDYKKAREKLGIPTRGYLNKFRHKKMVPWTRAVQTNVNIFQKKEDLDGLDVCVPACAFGVFVSI